MGIDVSGATLDLARSDVNEVLTVSNDAAGIGQVVEAMRQASPVAIVVEATGGLERALVDALLDAGLPVSVANPVHVRQLARGLGMLAKTDPIDARVLMEYARLARLRLAQKRDKNRVELEALVTCRRQLLHVRTEQTNRRSRTTSKAALKSIDAVLKAVERQIESLDEQIRKLIDSDDDMGRMDKLLRSVPGVGPVLAATLLSELGELGTISPGKVAALVGVAPYNNDSGKLRGKRSIHGGRAPVRGVLYMATLAAIASNPVIHAFAQRLDAAGKAPKVRIVACMRKLITYLNTMLRDNLTWHELNVVKTLAPNP